MGNQILSSLSKEKQMSLYLLVKIIAENTTNRVNEKAQEKELYQQAKMLSFNSYEFDTFLENLNPSTLTNNFSSFNEQQKDFSVGMVYDLMTCNGIPSEKEYVVAEEVFEKIFGMPNDDFIRRIEKIQSIGNFFKK